MFLILGLPWICESLHQFVGAKDSTCTIDTFQKFFFRATSAFNVLRGLLLFLIFPCKATIWKKLMDKFGLNWCVAKEDSSNKDTTKTLETRLTRGSMELKTFRGPSRRATQDDSVVLTRFSSLNTGEVGNNDRRLSLGEGKGDGSGTGDKTASLRRQLLAPPTKSRETKSLNA